MDDQRWLIDLLLGLVFVLAWCGTLAVRVALRQIESQQRTLMSIVDRPRRSEGAPGAAADEV